jgi:mRNA interferase MazF
MDNLENIKRGEVYFADLGDETVGSEQGGLRPVIIVQNNKGNKYSPTTIVITITTRKKTALPTHVSINGDEENGLKCNSIALCEQIRTIDKIRIKNKIGNVDTKTLNKIMNAVSISLAM